MDIAGLTHHPTGRQKFHSVDSVDDMPKSGTCGMKHGQDVSNICFKYVLNRCYYITFS